MFQILTQEGWPDVVVDSMRMTGDTVAPLVAIYFVVYHLFVTLIVMSLFVAVILDNLEMEEELKKIKQLKAREQTATARGQLPLRLRVFTKFPDRPQLVIVKRFPNDFPLPKIRDTFTRQFADEEEEIEEEEEEPHKIITDRDRGVQAGKPKPRHIPKRGRPRLRHIGRQMSNRGVMFIVE